MDQLAGKDGNLEVKANDKSDFNFSIMPTPLKKGQDLKPLLLEMAKATGRV
jgi:hypothetical protein